jgi:nitroreductase
MEFEKVIKERYSVRKYSSKKVEQEKIDKILNAGLIAPTAKNTQCQKIYVIKSEEGLKKLNAINPTFDAPLVFLVCGDLERQCPRAYREGYLMETDLAIVQTHMMLEATNLGLGSCWVCYFNEAEVAKAFELPSNVVPYNLLVVGYPSQDAKPSIRHLQSRTIEDTVIEL